MFIFLQVLLGLFLVGCVVVFFVLVVMFLVDPTGFIKEAQRALEALERK